MKVSYTYGPPKTKPRRVSQLAGIALLLILAIGLISPMRAEAAPSDDQSPASLANDLNLTAQDATAGEVEFDVQFMINGIPVSATRNLRYSLVTFDLDIAYTVNGKAVVKNFDDIDSLDGVFSPGNHMVPVGTVWNIKDIKPKNLVGNAGFTVANNTSSSIFVPSNLTPDIKTYGVVSAGGRVRDDRRKEPVAQDNATYSGVVDTADSRYLAKGSSNLYDGPKYTVTIEISVSNMTWLDCAFILNDSGISLTAPYDAPTFTLTLATAPDQSRAVENISTFEYLVPIGTVWMISDWKASNTWHAVPNESPLYSYNGLLTKYANDSGNPLAAHNISEAERPLYPTGVFRGIADALNTMDEPAIGYTLQNQPIGCNEITFRYQSDSATNQVPSSRYFLVSFTLDGQKVSHQDQRVQPDYTTGGTRDGGYYGQFNLLTSNRATLDMVTKTNGSPVNVLGDNNVTQEFGFWYPDSLLYNRGSQLIKQGEDESKSYGTFDITIWRNNTKAEVLYTGDDLYMFDAMVPAQAYWEISDVKPRNGYKKVATDTTTRYITVYDTDATGPIYASGTVSQRAGVSQYDPYEVNLGFVTDVDQVSNDSEGTFTLVPGAGVDYYTISETGESTTSTEKVESFKLEKGKSVYITAHSGVDAEFSYGSTYKQALKSYWQFQGGLARGAKMDPVDGTSLKNTHTIKLTSQGKDAAIVADVSVKTEVQVYARAEGSSTYSSLLSAGSIASFDTLITNRFQMTDRVIDTSNLSTYTAGGAFLGITDITSRQARYTFEGVGEAVAYGDTGNVVARAQVESKATRAFQTQVLWKEGIVSPRFVVKLYYVGKANNAPTSPSSPTSTSDTPSSPTSTSDTPDSKILIKTGSNVEWAQIEAYSIWKGSVVNLLAQPKNGYTIKGWTLVSGSAELIATNDPAAPQLRITGDDKIELKVTT